MRGPHVILTGAGTVNYWAAPELLASPNPLPQRITVIDRAKVKDANAITCPAYAGQSDRPKVECLKEILRADAVTPVEIVTLHKSVQLVNWEAEVLTDNHGAPMLVMMGLDDWPARLNVLSAVRRLVYDHATLNIVVLQGSLERRHAQLNVYSPDYRSYCCICGLALLPASEPCVVLQNDGRLLRGDLRREAAALAALVREAAAAILRDANGRRQWLDTKTILTLGSDGQVTRETRKREAVPGCIGPHRPGLAPLRWEALHANAS